LRFGGSRGFFAAKKLPGDTQRDIRGWLRSFLALLRPDRDASFFNFQAKRFELERLEHLTDRPQDLSKIEVRRHASSRTVTE
jgi:hypothetical protein